MTIKPTNWQIYQQQQQHAHHLVFHANLELYFSVLELSTHPKSNSAYCFWIFIVVALLLLEHGKHFEFFSEFSSGLHFISEIDEKLLIAIHKTLYTNLCSPNKSTPISQSKKLCCGQFYNEYVEAVGPNEQKVFHTETTPENEGRIRTEHML